MNGELKLLVTTIVGLSVLGLTSILSIIYFRPNADNTQLITSIIGFLAPTIMAFIAAFRGIQNSGDIKEVKKLVNGNASKQAETIATLTDHAVNQSASIATLTEHLAATKTAAELAAQTAADTAAALAFKTGTP